MPIRQLQFEKQMMDSFHEKISKKIKMNSFFMNYLGMTNFQLYLILVIIFNNCRKKIISWVKILENLMKVLI